MKLGIGSYALAWSAGVPGYERPLQPLTAFGLLELAKKLGVVLVQYADNVPLIGLTPQTRTALAGQAQAWAIELEAGTRGTDPEHLLEYLALCRDMGIKLLRTLITSPDLEAAERDIQRVLPAFEAAGVYLGIENHGIHTTSQLTALFRRINSPRVGCVLDTVNSFGALEGPEQVVEALSPYLVNLHLKDFDIRRADHQMGFIVYGTPAGAGRLHIPELLRKLEAAGRSANAILELWPPYEGSVEATIRTEMNWLEISLDYLKPLFKA